MWNGIVDHESVEEVIGKSSGVSREATVAEWWRVLGQGGADDFAEVGAEGDVMVWRYCFFVGGEGHDGDDAGVCTGSDAELQSAKVGVVS